MARDVTNFLQWTAEPEMEQRKRIGWKVVLLRVPKMLLVVFSEEVWLKGSQGLGILHAASGIGAVVGSIYVATRSPEAGRIRMMMTSVILYGGLLVTFAGTPWFLPAVALIFFGNIAASIFGTLNNTAIQLLIPDHVRGRISRRSSVAI